MINTSMIAAKSNPELLNETRLSRPLDWKLICGVVGVPIVRPGS